MKNWNNLLIFIISTPVSGFIGGKITLFLSNRKEKRESEIRFKNRLKSLAYELKVNFKNIGNRENPFVTKALENLVYNEPLIHHYAELFEKAQNCINIALILSNAKFPKQKPATGQQLMKDLSEYLSSQFNISVPDFE